MGKKVLSICISTRNRGSLIGATLGSIACQATEEVEIVVLDGASTDDTQEVVSRHQERFPCIRYFRQETNMGIDRDFCNAVAQAQGDYCWLFSDDDLIKPGAIQTVLDAAKGNYTLIVANSEVRNVDLSKILEVQKIWIEKDRIYKSNENDLLLADSGAYLSFIGGVIIKRQVWEARDKEKYFGSYFIHAGVIFQEPLPGDALVIAEPLISIRYANASWLGRYFEIWMFKWPGLIWSFNHLSDSSKRQVCDKEPWRDYKTLLHFRAKGSYSAKEYFEWIEPRLKSGRARAVSKAIAYLPGRLANLLAFLYYSTLRRPTSQPMILSDLACSPFCWWRLPKKRGGGSQTRPTSVPSGLQVSSSNVNTSAKP